MWSRVSSSSSAELLQILARSESIHSRWKTLNAFITECWDRAKEDAVNLAKNSDVERKSSALYAMPLAVKDNFCTEGVKTSCASKMLENFTPPYTATVVERLRQQGMLVVGKTNMDSFAMGAGGLDSAYAPTRNPWTLTESAECAANDSADFRIAGGSSGGSAAAVAAGIVYGALGSDTGGSVRIPASYCGVVGLKPTNGLLSRHGLIALVNSLDCPGILTQTVDQCTNMLNAAAGHDPFDSTTYHSRSFDGVYLDPNPAAVVRGLRVGIPQEYYSPQTSPEVVDTWREVAEVLSAGGATVTEVSLPHTQYSIACYSVLNCCEVASNMARFDGIEFGHRAQAEDSTESLYAQSRHEAFNDVVRGRIFAGNYFLLKNNYDHYYMKAAKLRRLIHREFLDVFKEVDILLSPVTIDEAPLYSHFTSVGNRAQCALQDVYTQPSNLAGVPAISLPIKLSSNNLPLGLQLIGRHFDEQTILNAAHFIEQEVCFPTLSRCDS